MLSGSMRKLWITAVIVFLGWASIQSEQVFAGKTYLTDEIGEGSIFHLDPHLHSLLASGSQVYFQEGHLIALTEINPQEPYCIFRLNSKLKSGSKSDPAAGDFVVHFANAASPHWFFHDSSELECRHMDSAEEFHATVQDLVSVEKHRELRIFKAIFENGGSV